MILFILLLHTLIYSLAPQSKGSLSFSYTSYKPLCSENPSWQVRRKHSPFAHKKAPDYYLSQDFKGPSLSLEHTKKYQLHPLTFSYSTLLYHQQHLYKLIEACQKFFSQEKVKVWGSGSFGKVYKHEVEGELYVYKVFSPSTTPEYPKSLPYPILTLNYTHKQFFFKELQAYRIDILPFLGKNFLTVYNRLLSTSFNFQKRKNLEILKKSTIFSTFKSFLRLTLLNSIYNDTKPDNFVVLKNKHGISWDEIQFLSLESVNEPITPENFYRHQFNIHLIDWDQAKEFEDPLLVHQVNAMGFLRQLLYLLTPGEKTNNFYKICEVLIGKEAPHEPTIIVTDETLHQIFSSKVISPELIKSMTEILNHIYLTKPDWGDLMQYVFFAISYEKPIFTALRYHSTLSSTFIPDEKEKEDFIIFHEMVQKKSSTLSWKPLIPLNPRIFSSA